MLKKDIMVADDTVTTACAIHNCHRTICSCYCVFMFHYIYTGVSANSPGYLLLWAGQVQTVTLEAWIKPLCTMVFYKSDYYYYKKHLRRWDTWTWHQSILHLKPWWRGSPGTISVQFCTEVKGWLRYKRWRYIVESFNPWVWYTNVTDDRRICDSKDPNVTYVRVIIIKQSLFTLQFVEFVSVMPFLNILPLERNIMF